MKVYILGTVLLLLGACNVAPPQNAVVDVPANNMIADDVTEVQDESAVVPTETDNALPAENGQRKK